MEKIIRNTIVLTMIMLVAGLSLGLTYEVTKPLIDATEEKEFMENLRDMFPDAERYEDVDGYSKVYSGGRLLGYVAESSEWGYSSDIKVMVGVDLGGEIAGVRVLSQKETPGIGTQVTGSGFLEQFQGKRDIDDPDTISGATISSEAAIEAVRDALDKMREEEQ